MQTRSYNILLYQNEVIEKITANAASIFRNSGRNPCKPPQNWPKLSEKNTILIRKMQNRGGIILIYQNEVMEKITANAALIVWNSWLNPCKPPKLM